MQATLFDTPPDVGLPADLEQMVVAEVDGLASQEMIGVLESHRAAWIAALVRLVDEAEDALASVRKLTGPERAQVVADFEDELRRLDETLIRLTGVGETVSAPSAPAPEAPTDEDGQAHGLVLLQGSWVSGHIVAWAGGPGADSESAEEAIARLTAAGAPSGVWQAHDPVTLPDGERAETVAAPIGDVLGWLVAIGAEPGELELAAGLQWLGQVAVSAVQHVARGRMVPRLRQAKGSARRGKGAKGSGAEPASLSVRWMPALTESDELDGLSARLPASVTALGRPGDARTVAQTVLADIVQSICQTAAEKLDVPAPPPAPKTNADVAEAFLARLDGSSFEAPTKIAAEMVRRLDRWARALLAPSKLRLVVILDPPDDVGAWHLAVLAPGAEQGLEPVEVALVTSASSRSREIADQLARLERMLPELQRPGQHRRGEVILDQAEAWRLMTDIGPQLSAAGYDVRVPALSRRKPTPSLRLMADEAGESTVGARQLANVSWSAVFDDVELTAEEIRQLAAQAKPLVRSRGQWVELDHVDLREAAAALAEQVSNTQMTGAEMLRHALGLEGPALRGGITLGGSGWASELLRSAGAVPTDPPASPDGFEGTLRSYQAEALAWLEFLDGAGLGGCLALDMGLGKTPTILARIRQTRGSGPALVVAPPAVVGNWAAEASKFTPELKVLVHHGPSRAPIDKLDTAFADLDVVMTTYGTAVRDVEGFEKIAWDRVVLDEAQVIKNHTSETAQQLRRIEARSRVALTGTPIENGLGDLWAILDYTNPGLIGTRAPFIAQLSKTGDDSSSESALRALNGVLVFRRTKAEPAIAAELPDRIDELDHCTMTSEQIGLYQAVLDNLVRSDADTGSQKKGQVLAAITALKQICNHPLAYDYEQEDDELSGRSGKLARLDEIVDSVFAAGERMLVFTHFAQWGEKLSQHITERTGVPVSCYHGGLARGARDRMVAEFQSGEGAGALVLSLKAGGTGLNLTAASHVVLYDRWWNPAVEDQARDRVWRIGQTKTVICHRLVCPGTVDERVEEVVMGKRRIADLVLPKSSSLGDLDADQLQAALGLNTDELLAEDPPTEATPNGAAGGDADDGPASAEADVREPV